MGLQLDFAFEGFRLIRARPRLVAIWGVVTLFGYGIAALALVAMAGPVLPALSSSGFRPPDTFNETAAEQATVALLAVAPIWLLTQAVMACALCRASLEPGEDPFGFLRFGMREIQIFTVMIATSVLTLMVMVSVVSALGMLHLPVALSGVAAVLSVLAGYLIQVRMSLNVPQSFAGRRIDLFGGIALTRGHFWMLAGGYVIAFAMACIVDYLGEQVIRAVVAVFFGESAANSVPDVSSLGAFLTPPHTVQFAIMFGLIMPQLSAILLAAPIGAWKALSPASRPAAVAP